MPVLASPQNKYATMTKERRVIKAEIEKQKRTKHATYKFGL